MYGKLILCATPIGNLKDVTLRVLDSLREADLIACEDTRHSLGFLNHYDIHVPLTSYHEHNKYKKASVIINAIKEGKNVALITDAGTPAISDPGEVLVDMCHEEGIRVTSLPGPSACITALTLSGISTRRFCFEGFLSQDNKERKEAIEDLKRQHRTIIIYEAPHHLKKTLKDLYDHLGNRRISLCRELTKQFETVVRTDLTGAMELYEREDPRGEYVLVIEGANKELLKKEDQMKWMEISVEEHLSIYIEQGMDKKAAMKAVASDRGVSKREIYDQIMKK